MLMHSVEKEMIYPSLTIPTDCRDATKMRVTVKMM